LIVGIIAVIVLVMIGTTTMSVPSSYAQERLRKGTGITVADVPGIGKAPPAISGDNVYVAWWTNETGNDEIMFRASTDGGTTFADKINLSNSTDAESQDVEIAADGDNVVITWWEHNATSNEPVMKVSTDNGATFGPLLKLAANGTIGGGG
jgi:hypothetical protein